MRTFAIAVMTAAAAWTAAPMLAGTASADPMQLAQADVDIRIGPRGPGVVIDDGRRRPGVVIETEGRRNRDCKTVTVTEWQNGARVQRTERRCD